MRVRARNLLDSAGARVIVLQEPVRAHSREPGKPNTTNKTHGKDTPMLTIDSMPTWRVSARAAASVATSPLHAGRAATLPTDGRDASRWTESGNTAPVGAGHRGYRTEAGTRTAIVAATAQAAPATTGNFCPTGLAKKRATRLLSRRRICRT